MTLNSTKYTCVMGLFLFGLGGSQQSGQSAELQYPLAIAVTGQGQIFLADRNLPGIWQVTDNKLSVYFEGSKKFRTPLNAVRCVTLDKDGRLLVGDSSTREVYRFDEPGKLTPLTKGGVGIPMSIGVNSKSEVIIADLEIHRIVKIPSTGGIPEKVADITAPRGLFVDSKDRIWVLSAVGTGKLLRISESGEVEKLIEDCQFGFPHNLIVDENDTAYVTDGYAKAIWRIAAGGKPEKWTSGPPFNNPVGLVKQGEFLWIADPRARGVIKVDAQGRAIRLDLEPPAAQAAAGGETK